MIRKTTAAVVLAGALALGTASATSLGDFDAIGFASGTVDLIDCQLDPNDIALVPLLPSVDDPLATDPDLDTETLLLDSLDLTALGDLTGATDCLAQVADIVIIGEDALDPTIEEVLEVQTDIDLSDAGTTPLPVNGTFDITRITEVRVVVHSPDPTP